MSPTGWTCNEKSSSRRTEPCDTHFVRVVVLDDWSLVLLAVDMILSSPVLG